MTLTVTTPGPTTMAQDGEIIDYILVPSAQPVDVGRVPVSPPASAEEVAQLRSRLRDQR